MSVLNILAGDVGNLHSPEPVHDLVVQIVAVDLACGRLPVKSISAEHILGHHLEHGLLDRCHDRLALPYSSKGRSCHIACLLPEGMIQMP